MASARRFQHANLNAPVLRAPLRGLVVRDRVILSKTYDGNPKQRDVLADQVTLHCFGSALAEAYVVLLGSRGVRESLHLQHVAGALLRVVAGDPIERPFCLIRQIRFIYIKCDGLNFTLYVVVVDVADAALKSVDSVVSLLHTLICRVRLTIGGLSSVLRGLRSLRLDDTRITDTGVENICTLRGLESLSLGGTNITDVSLQAIARIPSLTYLDLRDAKVTSGAVAALTCQREHLEISQWVP